MLWILEPEIGHHIYKKVNLAIWFHTCIRTIYKKTLIALPNLYFPKTALVETYLNVDDEEKRILHFTFLFPLFIPQKWNSESCTSPLYCKWQADTETDLFTYTQLSTTHHTWLATNSWTGLEGREARWSSRLSDFNQSAATNCITGSWATTLKMHIKMR